MPTTVEQLRTQVRGEVITPADPGYDEARRVYNAMHDRHPAVIVRCTSVADVMAVVRFSRERGGDLSVRGGSHSAPGFGTNDDGVVLDLSRMRSVRVDPRAKTARAEGGCTWGDFNHATHAFGLATTGGVVSTTGIGGLTLGGGFGYLSRSLGLAIDNLISADVVTADGRFLVASERENEDLFWALRGGGGNFGVVTSFEYRLHPMKDVVVGISLFAPERARDLFRFFREYVETAPEALGMFPAILVAPPLPFLPAAHHGKTLCAMVASWAGPAEQGEKVFAPIRGLGARLGEMTAPMPYPAVNALFDGLLPPGLRQYWKGAFAPTLPDAAIEVHLEHGMKVPTVHSAVHVYPLNGAVHRVAAGTTAFSFRDTKFATVLAGAWPNRADDEKNVRWVKEYSRALAPYSSAGTYVNFMDADEQGRVKDTYEGSYARLASIKKKYDPTNLFHLNQNIRPA